jgi:hypothetical protein
MPDRVLILANELITDARHELPKRLSQQASARELLVIAPMLTTRLQSLTSATDDAHLAAEQRLRHIADDMNGFRMPPLTMVGDENQLLAVADALAIFNADACVVITHTPEHANYHEHGVPQQIHEQFKLPTTTLTVNPHGRIVDQHTMWPET